MPIQQKAVLSNQREPRPSRLHVHTDDSDAGVCGSGHLEHTISILCARIVPDEWLCDACRRHLVASGMLAETVWKAPMAMALNAVPGGSSSRMTLSRTA
jgi:hypothetical protein